MYKDQNDNKGEQAYWQQGYGMVKHTAKTIQRITALVEYLEKEKIKGDGIPPYELLAAADRLTNAAMWLVVHQTYAKNVYLDGRSLKKDDFKKDPQGHLGGALNMVPAYVGYLLANALTGKTRSWVMEQGHAVSAIDTVNVLVNNMVPKHSERYTVNDQALSRFVQDFYSYELDSQGKPASPLGSHVNPYTAGGHMEGGYLGFASLQYVHMPLPGESLVAFLSDGAFEEQRGADWMPRWWRAEDSGLVAPIMIANGRRIDQRTILAQEGGVQWFKKFLKLHHFDPIVFDGRDPAAFAWTMIEQEIRLKKYATNIHDIAHYNVSIPYGIAVAPKGAGFYNEGTNYAHNLPLADNPYQSEVAANRFNRHIKKLYVTKNELLQSLQLFQKHENSARLKERDHPLANRHVALKQVPEMALPELAKVPLDPKQWQLVSPMDAVDAGFIAIVKANPHLRPRVGNPDEIRSNRMSQTLGALEFRVTDAEIGAEESTLGQVITALNEEAVAAAAFGNKGGINIVVTYEAFGAKMFGEARQEVTFSKHKKELGQSVGWLSVPIVLTSNTWENSKNELSHQDPSFAESMLSETSDISRVVFPADYHSAAMTVQTLYQTHGQVWSVVVPKQKTAMIFNEAQSQKLVEDGAIRLYEFEYQGDKASVMLLAIGAYQLIEVLKASHRLREKQVPHAILYMYEPGRFRLARNEGEEMHLLEEHKRNTLLPEHIKHILLVTHTRPELVVGMLQPIWRNRTITALGFINQGGTLGVDDMLFVNRCSWAHIIDRVAHIKHLDAAHLLSVEEYEVLQGKRSPDRIITKISS